MTISRQTCRAESTNTRASPSAHQPSPSRANTSHAPGLTSASPHGAPATPVAQSPVAVPIPDATAPCMGATRWQPASPNRHVPSDLPSRASLDSSMCAPCATCQQHSSPSSHGSHAVAASRRRGMQHASYRELLCPLVPHAPSVALPPRAAGIHGHPHPVPAHPTRCSRNETQLPSERPQAPT